MSVPIYATVYQRLRGVRRREEERLSEQNAVPIPPDSARRLKLAGFHLESVMPPLQTASPASSSTWRYRGNSRRSDLQSRSQREDARPPRHQDDRRLFAPAPPAAPIAGDVFAMHPELLYSPASSATSQEQRIFSPITYLKMMRLSGEAVSPSRSSQSASPSVIFIDCPPSCPSTPRVAS